MFGTLKPAVEHSVRQLMLSKLTECDDFDVFGFDEVEGGDDDGENAGQSSCE
jgi:hypothetical protein